MGPAVKGSVLEPSNGGVGIPGPIAAVAVGEGCTEAMWAPPGGAVGGDEGAGGIPGNEYISVEGGSTGDAAQGSAFVPSKGSDDDPGKVGGRTAGCDASPVAPASDAAIARKSASFRGAERWRRRRRLRTRWARGHARPRVKRKYLDAEYLVSGRMVEKSHGSLQSRWRPAAKPA